MNLHMSVSFPFPGSLGWQGAVQEEGIMCAWVLLVREKEGRGWNKRGEENSMIAETNVFLKLAHCFPTTSSDGSILSALS